MVVLLLFVDIRRGAHLHLDASFVLLLRPVPHLLSQYVCCIIGTEAGVFIHCMEMCPFHRLCGGRAQSSQDGH